MFKVCSKNRESFSIDRNGISDNFVTFEMNSQGIIENSSKLILHFHR